MKVTKIKVVASKAFIEKMKAYEEEKKIRFQRYFAMIKKMN